MLPLSPRLCLSHAFTAAQQAHPLPGDGKEVFLQPLDPALGPHLAPQQVKGDRDPPPARLLRLLNLALPLPQLSTLLQQQSMSSARWPQAAENAQATQQG